MLLGLLILSVVPAISQVTEKDKKDAVVAARQFTRQLQIKQDIRPLIKQFFATDFLANTIWSKDVNFYKITDSKALKDLDESTRNRFYVATTNFLYLGWIYSSFYKSKHAKDDDFDEDAVAKLIPDDVQRIMQHISAFSYLLGLQDDKHEMHLMNKTEIQESIRPIERMNSIYRARLRFFTKGSFTSFLRRLNDDEKPFFSTQLANCKSQDCKRIYKTTAIIGVRVPGFDFLDFARINGRMKIVRIFMLEEN